MDSSHRPTYNFLVKANEGTFYSLYLGLYQSKFELIKSKLPSWIILE